MSVGLMTQKSSMCSMKTYYLCHFKNIGIVLSENPLIQILPVSHILIVGDGHTIVISYQVCNTHGQLYQRND